MQNGHPLKMHTLNLSKQEVLLPNEKPPQDIIGYRTVLTRRGYEPCWKRISQAKGEIWTNDDVYKHVVDMIAFLRNSPIEGGVLTSEDLAGVLNGKDDDGKRMAVLQRSLGSETSGDILETRNKTHYMQINKPTLLIFVPIYSCLKFIAPWLTPKTGDLDPNCADLRSWETETVMGWYSHYKYGEDGCKPGKFPFYLEMGGKGQARTSMSLSLDPGTEDGNGQNIP